MKSFKNHHWHRYLFRFLWSKQILRHFLLLSNSSAKMFLMQEFMSLWDKILNVKRPEKKSVAKKFSVTEKDQKHKHYSSVSNASSWFWLPLNHKHILQCHLVVSCFSYVLQYVHSSFFKPPDIFGPITLAEISIWKYLKQTIRCTMSLNNDII